MLSLELLLTCVRNWYCGVQKLRARRIVALWVQAQGSVFLNLAALNVTVFTAHQIKTCWSCWSWDAVICDIYIYIFPGDAWRRFLTNNLPHEWISMNPSAWMLLLFYVYIYVFFFANCPKCNSKLLECTFQKAKTEPNNSFGFIICWGPQILPQNDWTV